MTGAYYNEFDPFAASWLRELIKHKLIADGDVDERPIQDVRVDDLKGYVQHHFFAGIGGWSYALRLAGWPDDRPVWSGSCPCQPFSSAGKQKGKEDERHLWPVWFGLIRESRPPVVFGEQVSAAIRHHWWDDVADDLEGEGYTTRAEIRPACSVGAPHKRDRLWFVANASCAVVRPEPSARNERRNEVVDGDVADTTINGRGQSNTDQGWCGTGICEKQGAMLGDNGHGTLGNAIDQGSQGHARHGEDGDEPGRLTAQQDGSAWSSGVWINCPDGKQRLIEPGIPLLASGVPNRVGKLRGYGNAIVPQTAAVFIMAAYS